METSRLVRHSKLARAFATKQRSELVWAKDKLIYSGAEVVKTYQNASVRNIIRCIKGQEANNWNYYEMVIDETYHALYLDIEFDASHNHCGSSNLELRLKHLGLTDPEYIESIIRFYNLTTSTELDEKDCAFYTEFYATCLKSFITTELGAEFLEEGKFHVLNSCRPDKFSIHIVVKSLVFESNAQSMRYFVWAFTRYLWLIANKKFRLIFKEFERTHSHKNVNASTIPEPDRRYIRLLFLHACGDDQGWFMEPKTGVDLTVYSNNQCFRMLGNRKLACDKNELVAPYGKPTTRLSYVKHMSSLTALPVGTYSYLDQICPIAHLDKLRKEFATYIERTLINVCINPSVEQPVVRLVIDDYCPFLQAILTKIANYEEKYPTAVDEPRKQLQNMELFRDDRPPVRKKMDSFVSKFANRKIYSAAEEIIRAKVNPVTKRRFAGVQNRKEWGHRVMDDTAMFYNSSGRLTTLQDIADDEMVFHNCTEDLYYNNQNQHVENYPTGLKRSPVGDGCSIGSDFSLVPMTEHWPARYRSTTAIQQSNVNEHSTPCNKRKYPFDALRDDQVTSPTNNRDVRQNTPLRSNAKQKTGHRHTYAAQGIRGRRLASTSPFMIDDTTHTDCSLPAMIDTVPQSQESALSSMNDEADLTEVRHRRNTAGTVKRKPNSSIGIDGITGYPCMKIFRPTQINDFRVGRCFACRKSYAILPTYVTAYYKTFPKENIYTGTEGTHMFDKTFGDVNRENLFKKMLNKFVVLQGPCGSGKTTFVNSFVKWLKDETKHEKNYFGRKDRYGNKSGPKITIIVFRKSLAQSLAGDEEDPDGYNCYTTFEGKYDTEENYYKWSNSTMCINSLMNVPLSVYNNFDFVFFDELRFTRFHLATDPFMGESRDAIMRILICVIKTAKTVIGAQDRLHERDVEFITRLRKINSIYDDGDTVDYFDKMMSLEYQYSDYTPRRVIIHKSKPVLIEKMLQYLHENGPTKRVVINVTKLEDGYKILALITYMIAKGYLSEHKIDRVKFLYAKNSAHDWQSYFLSDPNGMMDTYDILISSPVLQAEQSLDKCIYKVFCFYDLDILNHESEHQQLLRSRPWALMETPEIYVEQGRSGSRGASWKEQMNALVIVEEDSLSMSETQADVLASRADSHNRHIQLWEEDAYWTCVYPEDTPVFVIAANEKYYDFINSKTDGEKVIDGHFEEGEEDKIPEKDRTELYAHYFLINSTTLMGEYLKKAFPNKRNAQKKTNNIQKFRALLILAGEEKERLYSTIAVIDRTLAETAIRMLQHVRYRDPVSTQKSGAAPGTADVIYHPDETCLGNPDPVLRIGVCFNPEYDNATYDKLAGPKGTPECAAMMTRITNVMGNRAHTELVHRDVYESKRAGTYRPTKGMKDISSKGTVLHLLSFLGIPYEQSTKKAMNDDKQVNFYYIPMKRFFLYLKAVSKTEDKGATVLSLKSLMNDYDAFNMMTEGTYEEPIFLTCFNKSSG